jgi:hypothetical protein
MDYSKMRPQDAVLDIAVRLAAGMLAASGDQLSPDFVVKRSYEIAEKTYARFTKG